MSFQMHSSFLIGRGIQLPDPYPDKSATHEDQNGGDGVKANDVLGQALQARLVAPATDNVRLHLERRAGGEYRSK